MSSARDTLMAKKLKEGLQDALVYLRLLEGAKLAPVYERKRLQLMTTLLDLQGDTRREAPPKLEEDDDDEDDEESPQHDSSSPVKRRNSKLDDMKNKFNQPSSAKGVYRYKTLEELKKESALKKSGVRADSLSESIDDKEPTPEEDNNASPAKETTVTEKKVIDEVVEVEELKEEEENDLPVQIEEVDEVIQEEEEVKQEKKGRTHTLGSGLIGKLFKGKGKERSLTIPDATGSNDNISQLSAENSSTALEEDTDKDTGRLTTQLERVTRRLGKYSYQKVTATLSGDVFNFMKPKDKEGTNLSLVGAATAIRDSYQFELHTVDKSYTFRTESEDVCVKWVDALKQAIDACTPEPVVEIEEEIEEEPLSVPQITVDPVDNEPQSTEGGGANIKESLSYENFSFGKKKKQEMPDTSSLQIKGYLYKKGTFGWDKVWVAFTLDNTLFMSANESSKKVTQMLPVGPETKVEKKQNSDKKYPHGLVITFGKIKETLATDSQSDFNVWLSYLNQASGSENIQELLSEDEDAGELYEELDLKEPIPIIPVSPRPNHTSFATPTIPVEEELYDDFDGEIYEGLDDIELPETKPSPLPPSLPSRNESKVAAPTLPPRNQPQEVPTLPPRSKAISAYEAPLPSPVLKQPLPTQGESIDEELYDDVVTQQEEETYDDVLVLQGMGQETELEETYDDVVSVQAKVTSVQAKPKVTSNVSTDDLYEDIMTSEDQEEYCDMILPQRLVEDTEELYVDVDETPPPPRPPLPSSSSGGVPARPPPPASSVTRSLPPPTSSLNKHESPKMTKIVDGTSSPTQAKSSTLPGNIRSSNTPPRPQPPSTSTAAKRLSTTSSKVAHLSKMFGDGTTQQQTSPKNKRGTQSGTLLYMPPGKTAYSSDWCVLEGSTLIFYKGPNEKLSHYRLSTKDAELHMGLPEGKGSPLEFYIKKGSIHHKFSTNSLQELSGWLGPIANVITKVFPPPDCLYGAIQDHNGEGKEGEASFKKDNVLWVLGEDTPTLWVGIVGTSVNEFTGANGTFPSDKIGPIAQNEAVYI